MSKCKIKAGDRVTIRRGVTFYDCRITHACKDRLEVEEELSFSELMRRNASIEPMKWAIDVHRLSPPKKAKKTYFMDYIWTAVITLAGMSTGYLLASVLYQLFSIKLFN